MKTLSVITACILFFVAGAFTQAGACCENNGASSGACLAEPNNPNGTTLCYTTSPGENCTGSTFDCI